MPIIGLYSLFTKLLRIIGFLRKSDQVIRNRLKGLSYNELYNFVRGERDHFLSGILRISSSVILTLPSLRTRQMLPPFLRDILETLLRNVVKNSREQQDYGYHGRRTEIRYFSKFRTSVPG